MSDKEDKEKETLESHLTSEQDLSPRQSVRLSKLPIFIAVGLALVMFIFFAVGVGSKSQPKLSDEEKDAKALEVDKEKSQGKTGYTRDDLNSRSRTDIKGTIIEQLENQENNFQGDPNDQKEMVVQSTDEKDLANEQAMRDLLAMNNKLQAELLELKKKEVMSGKGGMAKIDEEELKAKKNMQHEIAGLKQRAFMQALTASSKTDVTSVNMRYFNKSNDALNEENGSLTGIKEQQQDLRTRINETNKRLSAMQSNNTGTQVIGGRGGNGYVDGLTPPPTVREVNNRGTPSTTASPDAYAVFEHSGEWDLQNQLVAPISDYIVRAGMVIPATLISGITSETQGQIMGQVSQNVYDTATGKYLLIPQGTRLVGTYQTGAVFGQERMLVAWQRLIYPDNKVLDLGSMVGADISGYSGFTDQVDNHWWKLISSAFLMSGITATISVATADKNNSDSNKTSMSEEGRIALANQFGSVVAQVIQRNLNVSPTLKIRAGYRFNVMITKDMTFGKPYQAFDYK